MLSTSFLNGLPPHIAQVIAHLAFLARRRALRPTEEYRTPTDAEWEEFLGPPVNCTHLDH